MAWAGMTARLWRSNRLEYEDRLGSVSEPLQVGKESLPDIPAQRQPGKLALALNMDQAGGLQFLEMVGQRCGGDRQTLAHICTSRAAIACAQSLHNLHPPRIAQRLQNRHALAC